MLSLCSQPLASQRSNMVRVMYSDVNRLMIRPTVRLMPKPLSWSLPTTYSTMAVKMLVRWVSMIVGKARS